MEARRTDSDAVEVTLGDGAVLRCYRANMGPGHGWFPVWIERDGVSLRAPEDALTDEVLAAIREVAPDRRVMS